MRKSRRKQSPRRSSPSRWLFESEQLYRDFVELTPFRFRPLARSFESFAEYERWKRAQQNPWYR